MDVELVTGLVIAVLAEVLAVAELAAGELVKVLVAEEVEGNTLAEMLVVVELLTDELADVLAPPILLVENSMDDEVKAVVVDCNVVLSNNFVVLVLVNCGWVAVVVDSKTLSVVATPVVDFDPEEDDKVTVCREDVLKEEVNLLNSDVTAGEVEVVVIK